MSTEIEERMSTNNLKRKREEDPLKIQTIPTKKDKIEQPTLAEADIIPRINSSILLVGHSGSGKTTLLANLMTRKDMYKDAFDEVFLISPTAKSDDVQKYLELDDDHIVDDLKEAPDLLKELMEEQRAAIESQGADKAPLMAILFDDVIANPELMKTPEFTKCFIACRHYNFTTFICSQSFKGVPKKCRLQANNVFFFRGSNTEMEAILEDRSPPSMNKKEGISMIEFATREPYDFLHINMRKPFESRYTRNLDETINYGGSHVGVSSDNQVDIQNIKPKVTKANFSRASKLEVRNRVGGPTKRNSEASYSQSNLAPRQQANTIQKPNYR